jgi:hypothetical protein
MYSLQAHLLGCHVSAWDYLRSHLAITSGDHIRRSHPKVAQWQCSTGDDPAFTDAEVITIASTGGYFRTDTPGADLPARGGRCFGGVPWAAWIQTVDPAPAATLGSGRPTGARGRLAGAPHRNEAPLRSRLAPNPRLQADSARPGSALERRRSEARPVSKRMVLWLPDTRIGSSTDWRGGHRNTSSYEPRRPRGCPGPGDVDRWGTAPC